MTFTLSPATPADIPGILDVWYAAYSSSTKIQTMNTPAVRAYLAECYARSIEEEQDAVMVMTEETEGAKRRVGAFAKLSLEKGGQPLADWRARWRAELPESLPAEVLEAFWAPISRQRVVVMGERAHMCMKPETPLRTSSLFFTNPFKFQKRVELAYLFSRFLKTVVLEVMATHPECQRRGLASTVVQWACERADGEGVEVYLDASMKGRPLYERFGFVAEVDRMDSESTSVPMRRPAKTS